MKVALLLLISFLIAGFPKLIEARATAANTRTRAIHVIFDDSGTMIRTRIGGRWIYNDRWGQQLYAVQVLAAMLEENDIMRVYYLSDFCVRIGGSTNAPARITLYGSESAEARVQRIRDTITFSSWTPFDPVIRAYNDLIASGADEKWLIILSDGLYNYLNGVSNNNIDVDGMLTRFASESDVNIFFVAMDDDDEIQQMIASLNPNPNIGYFFYHARTSREILDKITHMSNIIFNRNILTFSNVARHEFNFDIPMTELIVFAQGANVNINSIAGDAVFNPFEEVRVRYGEVPATNPVFRNNANVVISRELSGVIAIFRNIPAGNYHLNITGAQTIDIYFQPDVMLDIRLFRDGQEVPATGIVEGDYQVRFGIVNEQGYFFESALLGHINYEATVINNGRAFSIRSGETISLERGEFEIGVTARFLEINSAENTIRGRVLAEARPLEVTVDAPFDEISVTRLNKSSAITITVRNEGQLLSQSQWMSMPLPQVTTSDNVRVTDIRQGRDVSTFEFNIRRMPGNINETAIGNVNFNVRAELIYDEQLREGTGAIRLNVYLPDITIDIGVDRPREELTVTYLNEADAFVVTVRQNGMLLTEEQWLNMPMPLILSDADIEIVNIRRGNDVSTFFFNINQSGNDRFRTATGSVPISITADVTIDEIQYAGESAITVNIVDDITFWDRLRHWLERFGVIFFSLLFLLIIILGYMFKKRFPKSMKRAPAIQEYQGKKYRGEIRGSFKIYGHTKWLPFIAHKGELKFSESGIGRLKLRAVGNGRVKMLNLAQLARVSGFELNQESLKDWPKNEIDKKSISLPGAIDLSSSSRTNTYTCNPTVD